MDSNMVFWFQGFEKGIAALEQIEREKLFRTCGKNCVQQGTLAFYQELYQAAGVNEATGAIIYYGEKQKKKRTLKDSGKKDETKKNQ